MSRSKLGRSARNRMGRSNAGTSPEARVRPGRNAAVARSCAASGRGLRGTTDRLRLGIPIQRILSGLTTISFSGKGSFLYPSLILFAKELEAVPDMSDPHLLRM